MSAREFKVLITGGLGFIGKHIGQLLREKGHVIHISDIKNGEDVTDKKAFKKCIGTFQPDVIFHMAAILGTPETFSIPQERVLAVNVLGTINMLDIACEYRARFVYPGVLRIWHNPYSITKGCAEDYVTMYHKHYHLETVMLTLANVYGPEQRTEPYKKITPTLVMAALQNKPLPISGTGNQTVDMVHVYDVARAFVLASLSDKAVGHTIQIGTGKEYTVNQVAEMIIELAGSNSEIEYRPWRMGEDPDSRIIIDTRLAQDLLGFKAEIPLRQGLENTIEYYRKQIEV